MAPLIGPFKGPERSFDGISPRVVRRAVTNVLKRTEDMMAWWFAIAVVIRVEDGVPSMLSGRKRRRIFSTRRNRLFVEDVEAGG
ncbi:hypothetical protein C492_11225 [Natronococcus jeotgali DSM 18795]|uniref:Uncharacterized protein n=1 Tax=Natronococcus jeotgali DSM 18795 TaxID=1227498 RepID=L9XCX7_9EURY|nr:hypothetical protein C492_11225 [Natronococcus jeotgali DSM 18795]